jgi:hypothetical protein
MKNKERNAKSTGLMVAAILALFAGVSAFKGHWMRVDFFAVAAVALATAVTASATFARHFEHRWLWLAHKLGAWNTRALLAFLYILGFTSYHVIGVISGRDPLGRRSARQSTYWVNRHRTRQQPWQFERLY